MKVQKWLLFISILYTMNLISTTCWPSIAVAPNPSVFIGKDDVQDFKLHLLNSENGGVKKMIGSRPPSCENKCFGCMPCQLIQVPATSSTTSSTRGSLGMLSANYLPEGWKCKCGFTFFTP